MLLARKLEFLFI